MVVGIRVVRGPDWNKGNQDGGQDHVGTISRVIDETSVQVTWDMGESTTCRVGKDGQHDVIMFDNAPLGLSHPNVGCESCEEVGISGTLWKCRTCANVNLCTVCYHGDGHVTTHPFNRIDSPGSDPVEMPKRSSSQKSRALGLFPSAEVVRGKDWDYMDQDGGNGKVGIVEDVINFGVDVSSRNAVRVQWPNGTTNSYRVGCLGKVDLRCTEEGPGPDFYKDHLPKIDMNMMTKAQTNKDILTVGDRVCVHVTAAELRNLQQGRLVWNTRMEEIVGQIGILKRTTIEGHLEVDFDGDLLTLNKGAVQKVPEFKKGNVVKTIDSKEMMIRLQRNHGGWDDDMTQILGKTGIVSVIDKDGDVGVMFGDTGFVFHPNCLKLVSEGHDDDDDDDDNEMEDMVAFSGVGVGDSDRESDSEEEEEEEEDDDKKSDGAGGDGNGEDEDETSGTNDGFLQMFAGLVLLQALADSARPTSTVDDKERFMNAVVNGRAEEVEDMLKRDKNLLTLVYRGLPSLLLAAHQGHVAVVVVLLNAGMNIDVRDEEKKNTALIVAIASDKEDVAKLLIERGANANIQNVHGRTALHVASGKNMAVVVKALLEANSDPNMQDAAGDTALHDAIAGKHDAVVDLLLASQKLDLTIKNKKEMNTLAFACFKGHHFALDKIITKDRSLITSKASNGFVPLHIAAVNNHVNEATTLLIKARTDVNAVSDDGTTPLHLACLQAHFDMVKTLLTYEADYNVRSKDGNTPLHLCMAGRKSDGLFLAMLGLRNLAEDNERIKIADFLIQHGAKIDVVNSQGKTPITVCTNERMKEAVMVFAAKNKPTKPDRPNARPKTAKVEQEAFTTFNQKCHRCAENMSDTRFLPCKHTVSCVKCCFKYKRCPICEKEIGSRVGKDNRPRKDSGCAIA